WGMGAPDVLLSLCARASHEIGMRAFEALLATRRDPLVVWSPVSSALADGVRLYLRGDARAAVRAWRPALVEAASPGMFLPLDASDAAAEDGLRARIEESLSSIRYFNGQTPLAARAALRALARHDARGAELAKTVIDAWSGGDVELPVVVELKRALSAAAQQR